MAKKKYILFFEGTGGSRKAPTCISKLYEMLSCDDNGQERHLEPGSGAHKKREQATGLDSFEIVFRHYNWLARSMEKDGLRTDDVEIYVFGFSRGAYQSVVFLQVLSRLGVDVTIDSVKTLEARYFAAGMVAHRKGSANPVVCPKIKYVGLIDAVKSLHSPLPLPRWSKIPTCIPAEVVECRHAVAIHEYREDFSPESFVGIKGEITEQWFVGAHSDVGWGYNGSTNGKDTLDGIIEFLQRNNFVRKASTEKTSFLGRLVLAWIIDPVRNELKGSFNELIEDKRRNVYAFDYLMLLMSFPWIIHDSCNDPKSNGVRSFKRKIRSATNPSYHYSAEILVKLLRSGILKGVGVDGKTGKKIDSVMKDSLLLTGNATYILDLDIDSCHRVIDFLCKKFKTVFNILNAKSHSHTWEEEVREVERRNPSLGELLRIKDCLKNTSKSGMRSIKKLQALRKRVKAIAEGKKNS